MNFSQQALNIVIAKESGIIKTHDKFWKEFFFINQFDAEKLKDKITDQDTSREIANRIISNLTDNNVSFVCIADDDFPIIYYRVKNSAKPFLFFYRGDLSLLKNIEQNVAVIGLINPDEHIKKREIDIVAELVEKKQVIVSGLAKGCDTIAHEICVKMKAKTIAILPSPVNDVYPKENSQLADEIVHNGGLLLSEYYNSSKNKFESIERLVKRDRLQAMFSKSIIMIAACQEGQGDSGSKHAMKAAKEYHIPRYVMFNPLTDQHNPLLGLNKELLNDDCPPKIITKSSIREITEI